MQARCCSPHPPVQVLSCTDVECAWATKEGCAREVCTKAAVEILPHKTAHSCMPASQQRSGEHGCITLQQCTELCIGIAQKSQAARTAELFNACSRNKQKKTHCHSCPPPLLGLLKEEAKDLESKTPEGVLEYICDMYGPETVRKEIERLTRGHQSAPAWHKYRKGLVTASIAHACMTRAKIYLRAKATPNIAPFPSLILRTSHVSTPAMRAGSAKEDAARNTYVQWQEAQGHKVELQQTGLILRCDLPFIGCSPDGRVTFPCQCCEGKEVLKCL
ncbi:uncharacterized protein LOC144121522 isoform X2 [Amblyomma americanum]